MQAFFVKRHYLRVLAGFAVVLLFAARVNAQQSPSSASAQQGSPAAKSPTDTPAQTPAQIELLETRIRFEADGSSTKEVHTRVRINTELGTRQFARLNFDYNRAFEAVDIPLARITHASGGTSDILSGAITDQPNPAVAEAPAYQDLRRKTVRILGLQPTDQLEYRVVTTTKAAPLAPDFYLFHTFAKDSIVSQEKFELDLPSSRDVKLRVNPTTAPKYEGKPQNGDDKRIVRQWEYKWDERQKIRSEVSSNEPDISLTTFASWNDLSAKLGERFAPTGNIPLAIAAKAAEITQAAKTIDEKIEALYDFASKKIVTLDLPLGSSGFRSRPADEILASGYATPEDKALLFAVLSRASGIPSIIALTGGPDNPEALLPRPSMFTHTLVRTGRGGAEYWLDPGVEVAPFRMIASNFRGRQAFLLLGTNQDAPQSRWTSVPSDLPFAATQKVNVEASLAPDGKLTAKVHYSLRGDNELLLRVAFRQAPKDKWKDLAQLLSISDGFRGKVSSVNASDPLQTREPFAVDYEIVMPKFVDWNKKPVRIPALLPQMGLPDPPAKGSSGAATSPIDLGTPLDVQTHATLALPAGTTAHAPTGTSVERDYATFSSNYSTNGSTIIASRHLNFILRQVSASRATDYNAFLHAVQNDEAQDFVLERAEVAGKEKPPTQILPAAQKDR